MRGMFWNRLGFGAVLLVGSYLVFMAPRGAERAGSLHGLTVGQPIRAGNLSVFPIYSIDSRDMNRFITLDEGLAAGTVEIEEVGAHALAAALPIAPWTNTASATNNPPQIADDPFAADPVDEQQLGAAQRQTVVQQGQFADPFGDVNHLLVSNRSDQPLYLMPGEVFSGGNQDRTLAQEVIIPPGAVRTPIDVFCVESGRWAGRLEEETAQVAVALADSVTASQSISQLSAKVNQGKFPLSNASVGKRVRLGVNEGVDQGEIWQRVAELNAISGVITQSNDFTANYTQQAFAAKLKPYQERLQQPIADTNRVVGVIVAINGRPDSADWFESTPLFRKLWPKLLKSYALDAATAISNDAAPDGQAVRAALKSQKGDHVCSLAEAKTFLRSAMAGKVEGTTADARLTTTRRFSGDVAFFSATETGGACKTASPAACSDLAGASQAIHSAAFAKNSADERQRAARCGEQRFGGGMGAVGMGGGCVF